MNKMQPHRYIQCRCVPSQHKLHCGVEGINGICGLKEDDPIHRLVVEEPVDKTEVAA